MESKKSNRRLAAIMFTDIVGYTAMMQKDETQALAAVNKHDSVVKNTIESHDGELIQSMGDGSLSVFNSATQAVKCALEIQKQLLQPPTVMVRIGIHTGEIFIENGKIRGDGINIASRIQTIAQGGTVLFSKDVNDKVRNIKGLQIKSIGTYEFVNVDSEMEVFALWNTEIIAPDIKTITGKLKRKRQKHGTLFWSLIVSALLAVLGIIYFPFNKNPAAICELRITAPAEGSQVYESAFVSGTAVLPLNGHLWIFAHKVGVAGFWPQGYGAVQIIENEWDISVNFGNTEDIGAFEVVALVVSDGTNRYLENWIRNSPRTIPPYQPIALPAMVNSCRMAKLVVRKQKNIAPPAGELPGIVSIKKELEQIDNDLNYTHDHAQAYRRYRKLYNSLPTPIQKGINQDSLEKAAREYSKGGNPHWKEAAMIMRQLLRN